MGFLGGLVDKETTCNAREQETWTQSLGQEDPLKEGMATHSSILAWESHGQRSLAGYNPQGCKELDMTEVTEYSTAHSLAARNSNLPYTVVSKKKIDL